MVLSINEEVVQLKNDMNSYLFRKKKIAELENKLMSLENRMMAVSSPKIDNNKSTPSKHSDFRLTLIERKGYLEEEIRANKAINKRVDELIALIPEEHRDMITDIYINGKSHDMYAARYHYSTSTLKRFVNAILGELFSPQDLTNKM